jgi:signal peptidase I
MPNTLRELRNRYLKEGNLGKYLTYAIGEIVIVVAGILLALYLNNWNQKRSDKKLEIQYYQSMKNQLNEDLEIIIGEMDYNQTYLDQLSYAENLIFLNDRRNLDTLGKIAINMVKYSDFRRKSSIYQTLVTSGEIIIIKNSRIIEKLQNLEETYTYINRLEENHSTIILSQIIPDIRERIQFNPVKVVNPEDIFTYQFQNSFDILIYIMMEKSGIYARAKDEIQSLIDLIDTELKD